ncbi:hypothetical protein LMG7053_05305 [Achromobacter ruhlandii]|uniref:Uncharacterized protein n=1 Tax=Achromobacter ruhlandii TaxID=72557 RepID=A0ABM8M3R9_9BURK|nr:hypothetical protein LMG7053_05305 [Achromobacter ruhlandii]
MIAAIWIDPQGKRAVRRGDGVGRQGVGGQDCRRRRQIAGHVGAGLRPRHESIPCLAHVVKAQQRLARLELFERGIARDDPVGRFLDPHAGLRRVHASRVDRFRRGAVAEVSRASPCRAAGFAAAKADLRGLVGQNIAGQAGAGAGLEDGVLAIQYPGRGRVGRYGEGAIRRRQHRQDGVGAHADFAIGGEAGAACQPGIVAQVQQRVGEYAGAVEQCVGGGDMRFAVGAVDAAVEAFRDGQGGIVRQSHSALESACIDVCASPRFTGARRRIDVRAVVQIDEDRRAAQGDK